MDRRWKAANATLAVFKIPEGLRGLLYCKEVAKTGVCKHGVDCKALLHLDEAGAKQIDAGFGPSWDKLEKLINEMRGAEGEKIDEKGKGKGKGKGKRKRKGKGKKS